MGAPVVSNGRIIMFVTLYGLIIPQVVTMITGYFPMSSTFSQNIKDVNSTLPQNEWSCDVDYTLQKRIVFMVCFLAPFFLPPFLSCLVPWGHIPTLRSRFGTSAVMGGFATVLTAIIELRVLDDHFGDGADHGSVAVWMAFSMILTCFAWMYALEWVDWQHRINTAKVAIKKRGDLIRPVKYKVDDEGFPYLDFYDAAGEVYDVTREQISNLENLCHITKVKGKVTRLNNNHDDSFKTPTTILEVRDVKYIYATFRNTDVRIKSPLDFKAVKIRDTNYHVTWIVVEDGPHYDALKSLCFLDPKE